MSLDVAMPAARVGLSRFLAACRHEQPDATPVWFMHQASRYLPAYGEMLAHHSVVEITKTPELCTQATLLPVRELDVDAAVMYADIMMPLERMGIDLELSTSGPVIHNPVRSDADVSRLRVIEPEEDVAFVLQAIRMVRGALPPQKAVIGFSGAPFTLACYMIEGGPSRDYAVAKSFMYREPDAWNRLMETVSSVIIRYLRAQVAAGADAVQLFDSWIGALGEPDYRRYVQPHVARIFNALSTVGVPTIHFGTGTAALLEAMSEAGGDVVGVDWRVNLDEAWTRIGHHRGIQGNLDPTRLLAGWTATEEGARDVLRRAAGRPGHIFNLGHRVPPDTDPAVLRRLVDYVHETSAKGGQA